MVFASHLMELSTSSLFFLLKLTVASDTLWYEEATGVPTTVPVLLRFAGSESYS